MPEPAEEKERPCALCLHCDWEPAPGDTLVQGHRWHSGHEKYVIFRGYICEMHLATEDWLKPPRILK